MSTIYYFRNHRFYFFFFLSKHLFLNSFFTFLSQWVISIWNAWMKHNFNFLLIPTLILKLTFIWRGNNRSIKYSARSIYLLPVEFAVLLICFWNFYQKTWINALGILNLFFFKLCSSNKYRQWNIRFLSPLIEYLGFMWNTACWNMTNFVYSFYSILSHLTGNCILWKKLCIECFKMCNIIRLKFKIS